MKHMRFWLVPALAAIMAVPGPAGADLLGDLGLKKFEPSQKDRPSRGGRDDVGVPEPVVVPGAFAFSNGQKLFAAGDYQGALSQFRAALDQAPGDTDYLAWHAACLAKLNWRDEALEQLRAALARSDISDQQRSNLQGLANDIRQAVWVDTANAGGRELDKIESQNRRDTTAGAGRELARLEANAELFRLGDGTGDAMVVDARGTKPFADVIAQFPELGNSEVAERARKGLVAMANHDFNVARAMYQDALNRDPGNRVLMRAVDLADWMAKQKLSSRPIRSISADQLAGLDPGQRAVRLTELYRLWADDIAAVPVTNEWDRRERDRRAEELRTDALMFDMMMKPKQGR